MRNDFFPYDEFCCGAAWDFSRCEMPASPCERSGRAPLARRLAERAAPTQAMMAPVHDPAAPSRQFHDCICLPVRLALPEGRPAGARHTLCRGRHRVGWRGHQPPRAPAWPRAPSARPATCCATARTRTLMSRRWARLGDAGDLPCPTLRWPACVRRWRPWRPTSSAATTWPGWAATIRSPCPAARLPRLAGPPAGGDSLRRALRHLDRSLRRAQRPWHLGLRSHARGPGAGRLLHADRHPLGRRA
jgi:hypothetical protein